MADAATVQAPQAKAPTDIPADRIRVFDIYNLPDDDLHVAWMGLRDSTSHDMVWTPYNGGHWIALKPELIADVLTDATRFSSLNVLVPKETSGAAYRFIPLSLDPPQHKPFRKILNDNMYGGAIRPMELKVRELTISLIEGFLDNGRCDFVKEFADQFPLQVFMQLVDLPMEDLPRLKHLADQFTRPDGSITPQQASDAFIAYIVPVLQERKATDRDDLLSNMARGEVFGRPVTDEEAARMAIQVLVGGLDTVVNLMSLSMLMLAKLPEVQARMAADPSVHRAAIHECLRRFPIVSSAREVVAEIEVDGTPLHKGDMVVAPTELFAMNERMNEDPMRFDLDRKIRNHNVFGSGHHICPGQFLARMEMKVFFEEWFKRIPSFELEFGQNPRHFGGITAGCEPFCLRWPARAGG